MFVLLKLLFSIENIGYAILNGTCPFISFFRHHLDHFKNVLKARAYDNISQLFRKVILYYFFVLMSQQQVRFYFYRNVNANEFFLKTGRATRTSGRPRPRPRLQTSTSTKISFCRSRRFLDWEKPPWNNRIQPKLNHIKAIVCILLWNNQAWNDFET